jgi:predicted MFS family arabinose efflux permease
MQTNFIDKNIKFNNVTAYAWTMWSIAAFFFLFQYILRISPGIMMKEIMQKFSITAEDFGYYSASYYFGYALMHLPFGIMLDRYKIHIIIFIAISLTTIGLIPLVFFDSWCGAIIGRFLVGAGSSGAILAVFKVTSSFFPENMFSKMLGAVVTVGIAGALYSNTQMSKLHVMIGWQNVLLLLIIIGLIIAIIVFIAGAKKHLLHSSYNLSNHNIIEDLKAVFTNKKVVTLAIYASLFVGTYEGFADVWATPFLEKVYGFDHDTSVFLPMLIFAGMCIGSSLLPIIAEKFKAYYIITINCGIVMFTMFLVLIMYRPNIVLTTMIFILIGICCGYKVLIIYMNNKNSAIRYQNLAAALTNMSFFLSGSIFHSAIGKIVHLNWNGQIQDNIIAYSPHAYIFGISIIPIGLLLGVLGISWLKFFSKYSCH